MEFPPPGKGRHPVAEGVDDVVAAPQKPDIAILVLAGYYARILWPEIRGWPWRETWVLGLCGGLAAVGLAAGAAHVTFAGASIGNKIRKTVAIILFTAGGTGLPLAGQTGQVEREAAEDTPREGNLMELAESFFRGAMADQLAAELGMPIDVIGVRGSGATPARINLYREGRSNPGYIETKKLVIWCFAAREFTESCRRLIDRLLAHHHQKETFS